MKKFLTLFVLIATVFAVNAQDQYAFTSKASVNLRKSPSSNGIKAGSLTKGMMLPLLEADWETGWNKVLYKGESVYVSQSVSEVCDASVPIEMFKKSLDSSEPLDKVRFQGSIMLSPIDKNHVGIEVTWMRMNLPAETYCYIADRNESGAIVATYCINDSWINTDLTLSKLLENASKIDNPIPVGFNEFNNTIYFDGGVFSEFE